MFCGMSEAVRALGFGDGHCSFSGAKPGYTYALTALDVSSQHQFSHNVRRELEQRDPMSKV